MNSVGQAYAVLRGRLSGDQGEATKLLESLSPAERSTRNRLESRMRGRRLGSRYKMGRKSMRSVRR